MIATILLCIIPVISMISCLHPNEIYYQRYPYNFPGTTYSTEDGSIWFNVYEEDRVIYGETQELNTAGEIITSSEVTHNMFGQITKDDKIYECIVEFYADGGVTFISTEVTDVYNSEISYGFAKLDYVLIEGQAIFNSKTNFELTVWKNQQSSEVQLYEPGTVLEFFRTDTE